MNPYYLLDEIFPFLVLFYVVDSIAYVRPFQLLLLRSWGQSWRLKAHGFSLGGILPTSSVFVASNPPLYFTSLGFFAQKADLHFDLPIFDPHRAHFVSYEEIESVAVDEGILKVNDQPVLKLRSATIARTLQNRIQGILATEPSERGSQVAHLLAQSMDLDRLETRLQEHRGLRRTIRTSSSVFFVLLFVALPLKLYGSLLAVVPLAWLLALLGVNYLAVATLTIAGFRRLMGGRSGWSHLLAIALSPVTAAHIMVPIDKELLVDFDFTAVAARFLPDAAFTELMRRELGRMTILTLQHSDHGLIDYWRGREIQLHKLLSSKELPLESVTAPPPKRDVTAEAYCVLCDAEYHDEAERCDECDAPLMKY
jgi:hypothetical protein